MPSIPQSLLWISLVVLWLFVLVPMLINKRDTVRRTSDVALSTRVVNGGLRSRLLRRGGPAAGHRHDPDWRPQLGDLDEDSPDYPAEDYEEAVAEAVAEAAETDSEHRSARSMMVVADPADADTEPVYLDVDVVEETSGALPVGDGVQETLFEEAAEPAAETAADPTGEYEYVEDTSGLEDTGEDPEEDTGEDTGDADGAAVNFGPTPRSRRRRMESSAAAAVTARKYRFRKRMLTAMAAAMVLTATLSLTISADLWWTCTAAAAVTILYLGYLRRQTRIEEQVRRRRQQRMARIRYADEGVQPGPHRDVSSRLHRPGAAVLDIDDEDPVFEHLDQVAYSRRYDLPRAAGQ